MNCIACFEPAEQDTEVLICDDCFFNHLDENLQLSKEERGDVENRKTLRQSCFLSDDNEKEYRGVLCDSCRTAMIDLERRIPIHHYGLYPIGYPGAYNPGGEIGEPRILPPLPCYGNGEANHPSPYMENESGEEEEEEKKEEEKEEEDVNERKCFMCSEHNGQKLMICIGCYGKYFQDNIGGNTIDFGYIINKIDIHPKTSCDICEDEERNCLLVPICEECNEYYDC